jgi:hypothetical protein
MVPSSASSERGWSAFGFIHSKVRNRLATVRAQMLVYVYFNLRLHMKLPTNRESLMYLESLLEDLSLDNEDTPVVNLVDIPDAYDPSDFEVEDSNENDEDFSSDSEGSSSDDRYAEDRHEYEIESEEDEDP